MPDAFPALTSKMIALRGRMQERIERITANIDLTDANQVDLANKELDELFADGRRQLGDMVVDEIIRVAVIEPIANVLLGPMTDNFLKGGLVSEKFLGRREVYSPSETVIPRSPRKSFKKSSKR